MYEGIDGRIECGLPGSAEGARGAPRPQKNRMHLAAGVRHGHVAGEARRARYDVAYPLSPYAGVGHDEGHGDGPISQAAGLAAGDDSPGELPRVPDHGGSVELGAGEDSIPSVFAEAAVLGVRHRRVQHLKRGAAVTVAPHTPPEVGAHMVGHPEQVKALLPQLRTAQCGAMGGVRHNAKAGLGLQVNLELCGEGPCWVALNEDDGVRVEAHHGDGLAGRERTGKLH